MPISFPSPPTTSASDSGDLFQPEADAPLRHPPSNASPFPWPTASTTTSGPPPPQTQPNPPPLQRNTVLNPLTPPSNAPSKRFKATTANSSTPAAANSAKHASPSNAAWMISPKPCTTTCAVSATTPYLKPPPTTATSSAALPPSATSKTASPAWKVPSIPSKTLSAACIPPSRTPFLAPKTSFNSNP